jgi:hypothetical protein
MLRLLIGQDYDCKFFWCFIECKKARFMSSFGYECLSNQYNNVYDKREDVYKVFKLRYCCIGIIFCY